MIFWTLFFLYAAFCPLTIKINKKIYLSGIGIIASADIFGIFINDITVIPFSFFVLVQLLILIYSGFSLEKYVKLFLNNGFNIFILSIISITALVVLLSYFIYKDTNFFLFIRPIILFFQWFVIFSFYLKFIYKQDDLRRDLLFICFSLIIFTLLVVLYQSYGFQWFMPVNSSTYQLSEIREFGQAMRPAALTREPAHLTVVALTTLSAIYALNVKMRTIAILLVMIILVGYFSDTRSIILISLISFVYFYLFLSDLKIVNKLILSILIISLFYFSLLYISRLDGIFNINTDESTFTRYGLIIASIYYYLNNPWDFIGIEHAPELFCASGYNFISLAEICGRYDGAILNSTISFLLALPFFINIILVLYFYFKKNIISKIFIYNFLLSGLVLYQWAYPIVGLYLFFVAIISLQYKKCHS